MLGFLSGSCLQYCSVLSIVFLFPPSFYLFKIFCKEGFALLFNRSFIYRDRLMSLILSYKPILSISYFAQIVSSTAVWVLFRPAAGEVQEVNAINERSQCCVYFYVLHWGTHHFSGISALAIFFSSFLFFPEVVPCFLSSKMFQAHLFIFFASSTI